MELKVLLSSLKRIPLMFKLWTQAGKYMEMEKECKELKKVQDAERLKRENEKDALIEQLRKENEGLKFEIADREVEERRISIDHSRVVNDKTNQDSGVQQ